MNERSLFVAASRQPDAAARAAFLDEACANDPALRQQVETLLREQDRLGSFLEAPAALLDRAPDDPLPEPIGTTIGPYKLMEQIGEGGMGLVYVAEQHHPVRRKVALKLIKPGMDTRQVIARFEAERQALALMDHPNIARVIDGGTTGEPRRVSDRVSPADETRGLTPHGSPGRPYFVMELVRGVPITEYCDEHRLTPRARLELFLQVCAAVQHAHQKGIIHRDIKPSNVMIASHDGTPVVKVIDFGVAKAIGQQLTDKTVYTHFAQFIGTPLYMSPEQAGQSALDIDTRTDIYALGVLLYELLAGTTPFDKERLRQASYDEMRRLIREEEPPKPSTRLSTLNDQAGSTVSAQRQSNTRELSLLFRGELDWIVMKSLEKDRNRRYESASALAADVERYLKDEPVQACPPSRRYLLGKFLRRRRAGVLMTAAMVAAALVLGAGGAWVALDRAARRTEAEQQRVATEQAVADDLKEAEIWQQQEQWAKAIPALERAKGRLEGSGLGALQARVETQLRDVALITRLQEARLKGSINGLDGKRAGDRLYSAVFAEQGLDVAKLDFESTARQIRASAIRKQLVAALDDWAFVKQGLPDGNAVSLRTIVRLADDDPWRRQIRDLWEANDQETLLRLADAEEVLSQPPANLLLLSDLLGRLPPGTRLEKATVKTNAPKLVQLLRKANLRYPADFWINYKLGSNLAVATFLPASYTGQRTHESAEAIGFMRTAVALQPQYADLHALLGHYLWNQTDLDEAVVAYRMAIERQPNFPDAFHNLGNVLHDQRKWPEAIAAYQKAIELQPDLYDAYVDLGNVLREQRKWSEAVAVYQKAIDFRPNYYKAHYHLGIALAAQQKRSEAIASFERAIELEPKAAPAYLELGNVLIHQQKLPEAAAAYQQAIDIKPTYVDAHHNLGLVLAAQKKLPLAVAAYRKAIELKPDFALAHWWLGQAHLEQGQFGDSVASLKRGHELGSVMPNWPYRSAEKIRQVEEFARLDAILPNILKGEILPANAAERLALAKLCAMPCRQLYVAATRFFDEAFTAEPKLANDFTTPTRYDAACAAAQAGCGQGNDAANLDPKEYSRLRGQALAWLRADLTAWQREMNAVKTRLAVRPTMQHWQKDPEFNGVRGEAALAKLPEAERHEWQKLWEDVVELERRAADAK
jgi:serine/threonine protein kinase/tetratricopeptide (TPR) repeat protein